MFHWAKRMSKKRRKASACEICLLTTILLRYLFRTSWKYFMCFLTAVIQLTQEHNKLKGSSKKSTRRKYSSFILTNSIALCFTSLTFTSLHFKEFQAALERIPPCYSAISSFIHVFENLCFRSKGIDVMQIKTP